MIQQDRLISLQVYKRKMAARRGFNEWNHLFRLAQDIDENTRWFDLPDWVILFFCEDSPESRLTVYDLLMGVTDLGVGYELESLPSERLTPLLDTYFILMDQVHFECMRRLGWIEDIPWASRPITNQVLNGVGVSPFTLKTPRMTSLHPAFNKIRGEDDFDYGSFLRRHIPDAVKEFRKKISPVADNPKRI